MRLDTENVDDKPAPVGAGSHPYFLRQPTWRDTDAIVLMDADRVYPLENCLPTGPAEPVEGDRDLRLLRSIGNRKLDDCFTGFTENIIRLIYPGSRVEIRFEFDESFTHAIIYAPVDAAGNPGSFVAIEPVTHVTNGINLREEGWKDTGIRILDPGESWSTTWSLSVGDV